MHLFIPSGTHYHIFFLAPCFPFQFLLLVFNSVSPVSAVLCTWPWVHSLDHIKPTSVTLTKKRNFPSPRSDQLPISSSDGNRAPGAPPRPMLEL